MTHFTYEPQGVCSKQISFDIENNLIHNICFVGGCPGNLQAVAKLAEGKNAREITIVTEKALPVLISWHAQSTKL